MSMKKTLEFALSALKIREFKILKRCMQSFVAKKKCRADVTIYREAKRCMNVCNLHFLKGHWEPSENPKWFTTNVLCGKKRPAKKFRLLYEWVEDEIDEHGSILASEVRCQAGLIVGEGFDKYKKFENLSSRIKTFFNLKTVKVVGSRRPVKWISKK